MPATLGRIGTVLEMIKVVELDIQSAFAAWGATHGIGNTGFWTLRTLPDTSQPLEKGRVPREILFLHDSPVRIYSG
jgi:hypothetical protein